MKADYRLERRILERSGLFYPQTHSFIWGWQYHTESGVCSDGVVVDEYVRFKTLEEARRFFIPEPVVIHSVIS